jgi:hypothetical protein
MMSMWQKLPSIGESGGILSISQGLLVNVAGDEKVEDQGWSCWADQGSKKPVQIAILHGISCTGLGNQYLGCTECPCRTIVSRRFSNLQSSEVIAARRGIARVLWNEQAISSWKH